MNKISDYPLSLKSCDVDGSFKGYASVFGITDSQGEEIMSGAFAMSLKAWEEKGKMPKLLWQHDYRQPIGIWRDIHEDCHGLYVEGQLLLELEQGREAYTLLKNGVVDGLSVGFVTLKSRRKEGRSSHARVRVLEEVSLQEVSLVTFAANPLAKVDQVKMLASEMETLITDIHNLRDYLKGG